MSLIQQALERAQENPYTKAVEAAEEEKRQNPPPPKVMEVPASQPQPVEEEVQLRTLEKKIKRLKKIPSSRFSLWVIGGICLAALTAGVFGIHAWMRSSSPAESKEVSPFYLSQDILPKKGKSFSLKLTGITSSGGVRYALINNQVVSIGDMLKKENAVVKDILPRSAVVDQGGRLITLSLDT